LLRAANCTVRLTLSVVLRQLCLATKLTLHSLKAVACVYNMHAAQDVDTAHALVVFDTCSVNTGHRLLPVCVLGVGGEWIGQCWRNATRSSVRGFRASSPMQWWNAHHAITACDLACMALPPCQSDSDYHDSDYHTMLIHRSRCSPKSMRAT
jgi:hypothetical protein